MCPAIYHIIYSYHHPHHQHYPCQHQERHVRDDMRHCPSDDLAGVDPEAGQRCQAETDRRDIVLTGSAVFVSIIQHLHIC